MRSKKITKQTRLVIIFIVCALFPVLLYFFLHISSIYSSAALVIKKVIVIPGQETDPVRLKIPEIGLDAPMEYVSLTAEGAMGVPKNIVGVGWFKLGPRPGEVGSAVISGHYGFIKSKPAVFNNLNKLKKGDKIYVKDNKGVMITFVVRESREYDPQADATDIFVSSDGKSHLNLITCEGVWDSATKTYSNRLVIFADKEEK